MAEPKILGAGPAADHARDLLPALAPVLAESRTSDQSPCDLADAPGALQDWAASGAMHLTGRADGPPQASTGRPASALRAALSLTNSLAQQNLCRDHAKLCSNHRDHAKPCSPSLLGERAAIAGLTRQSPISCGGALTVIPCRTSHLAISLARPDDHELIPALIEGAAPGDPWTALTRWCATQDAAVAAERAQLLGLPAASVPGPGAGPTPQDQHRADRAGHTGSTWLLATPGGSRRRLDGPPLVLDLSALWAGPLTAHLLGRAGARVVKVESPNRPDGARRGAPGFYDLLNAGAAAVALDLATPEGRKSLLQLIRRADVVLESARPRALRQLGIDADEVVANGTTWLSITAQGRSGPWSNRVGFGDDVALGAGLRAHDPTAHDPNTRDPNTREPSTREPNGLDLAPAPAGDAIADPLTGVHAALAVTAALGTGRAWLLDVAMHQVAALSARGPVEDHTVIADGDRWLVETAAGRFPVTEPQARAATGTAAALGQDNARFLATEGPA